MQPGWTRIQNSACYIFDIHRNNNWTTMNILHVCTISPLEREAHCMKNKNKGLQSYNIYFLVARLETGEQQHNQHTHIHTRLHAHPHMCACTHTHTHTHAHACTHTHMCAHTHTYTHLPMLTHTHMHACTQTHTLTHTHTHAHTCTHAFTHTHRSQSSPSLSAYQDTQTQNVT